MTRVVAAPSPRARARDRLAEEHLARRRSQLSRHRAAAPPGRGTAAASAKRSASAAAAAASRSSRSRPSGGQRAAVASAIGEPANGAAGTIGGELLVRRASRASRSNAWRSASTTHSRNAGPVAAANAADERARGVAHRQHVHAIHRRCRDAERRGQRRRAARRRAPRRAASRPSSRCCRRRAAAAASTARRC